MTQSELYKFVKEKSESATWEDEYLSGLNFIINDHDIDQVDEGQVFEDEKIAYFRHINYSNPQLGVYLDNGITYFEYDELNELFDNGAADFFIKPKMK